MIGGEPGDPDGHVFRTPVGRPGGEVGVSIVSEVVAQLLVGTTAESGIWPVTRIGQCLIEGVPAECCAFDAHRELHHAAQSLQVA